jgi:hypothetical protein
VERGREVEEEEVVGCLRREEEGVQSERMKTLNLMKNQRRKNDKHFKLNKSLFGSFNRFSLVLIMNLE